MTSSMSRWVARLVGERYEFGLPWGVTRWCVPGGMPPRDRFLTRRWYRAGWGAVSGDQAKLPGPGGSLGAVGGAELAQHVGHVLFDRVQRHHQVVGDALIRPARREQPQHLQLTGGQRLGQARRRGRRSVPWRHGVRL